MDQIAESAGGQGAALASVLTDPHHIRADIKTLQRAVREDWPVPPEVRPEIIRRLVGIVSKTENVVQTMNGQAMVDGPADRNAIAAAALLRQMTADRSDDERHLERLRYGDKHPTTNVQVNQTTVITVAPPRVIGE